MSTDDKVNILLVDDQPGKLLTYETILRDLDETLLKASSAREALEHLLKTDVAVILVDVFMPDLDGFQLAKMIREHPRFQRTAIIFISAVLMTDVDFLRGYESGAVDYVSVPVVPDILRAKVRVFAELYRKTQQLEQLNRRLEERVAERTAELEELTSALRNSEKRLRLAFDAAHMGWWDYDVLADRVTWSPSLERLMGFSADSFGASLQGALDHVHPDDRERFLDLVERGTAADQTQACELRFVRPDGSVRWSHAAGQVIRDGDGRPTGFAGVDLDITARKQAEEQQNVLVRELDHRAKNLLAVVQSVIRLTKADGIAGFVSAVEGRIQALSRAHTLLSESRWHGVDLKRLVEEEIAPFSCPQSGQIEADGPSVVLQPATAQSLALALHELMTNAVKYGALSVPQGRLVLSWAVEPKGLTIGWLESGGPLTEQPRQYGFGTTLVTASIERQLSGRILFDWRPEGLRCSLEIPLGNVAPAAGQAGSAKEAGPADDQRAVVPRVAKRILLVEDEALVALMMHEVLRRQGLTVIGPVSTVHEALSLAAEEHVDGAILDVNLNGQSIYPVADLLASRATPFVFVTGYHVSGIDHRYAHVPVLEKPISSKQIRELFGTFDAHGRQDEPPARPI